MDTIVYILLGLSIVSWIVRRWIFNPSLTEAAVNEYTEWLITNLTYDELITKRNETFEFNGRKLRAHTVVHSIETVPGLMVVEIDVHPSENPIITISKSNFIILKDRTSLAKWKSALEGENVNFDYATQEDFLGLTEQERRAVHEKFDFSPEPDDADSGKDTART